MTPKPNISVSDNRIKDVGGVATVWRIVENKERERKANEKKVRILL